MRTAIETEWATAELGHASRTKRVQLVGRRWALKPQASFPKMVDSEGELEGLYGLCANEDVDHQEVLASHARASRDRIDESGCTTFLIVHDTTEFSFGGESIRDGLGWIARNTQGFVAHIALALSADGAVRPFGVVGLSTIHRPRPPARVKGEKKKPKNGKKSCLDPNRESLRWGALVDETSALFRGHAIPIHITDREADAYEYLSGRVSQNQRFVARADELARPVQTLLGEQTKLRLAAQRAVPVITREVTLRSRPTSPFPKQRKTHPPRAQRVAHLEFAAVRVRIKRPSHLPSTMLDFIDVNIVHVREPNPPPDTEPVEWFLLTSEPIDTPEQILCVVDYYRARWTIEIDQPWHSLSGVIYVDAQPSNCPISSLFMAELGN